MKTINLTRVVNEKDGTFMYVDEDFDNGITLQYTEDKENVYVQVRRTVGDKPYSDEQMSDINKYLRDKGFVDGTYNAVRRFFPPFKKDKFEYLGRDMGEIKDVISDEENIKKIEIHIPYTASESDVIIKDYNVLKDFCNYFNLEFCDKDIITEDTIKRVSMIIPPEAWNMFAENCGYSDYTTSWDIQFRVEFKENDKIRGTYTLLEDIATRNIDNVELGREKKAEFIELVEGVER